MIKGIIADVDKKKAVLLSENGEFLTIRNENYTIGQKIVYKKPSVYKYASMAACFVLVLILGTVGIRTYFTSTSYVDIDINPSVRLEINRMDKVIRAIPLNDDAIDLLSEKKISGDIKSCINTLVDESVNKGYINENNTDVEIVVISDKTEVMESVNVALDEVKQSELTVTVEKADYEVLKEAEALNVSVNRLKVLEEYTEEFGGTVAENAELLAKDTNSDIRAKKHKNNNLIADATPTATPKPIETSTPVPKATEKPSASVATAEPTKKPVWSSSVRPVVTEIPVATEVPAVVIKPTNTPVVVITVEPTKVPTPKPTVIPTEVPTEIPTLIPTEVPTNTPTVEPTIVPTATPTVEPTIIPTPTAEPTVSPTVRPTDTPSPTPTHDNGKDDPFWPWWDWIFGDVLE